MIDYVFKHPAISLLSSSLNTLLRRKSFKSSSDKLIHAKTLERIIGELTSPGIILLDRNCHCTYSNPGWHQLSGINSNQLAQKDWLRAIHRDEIQEVYEGCMTAIKTRQKFQTECRLHKENDGSCQTWLNFEAVPIFEDNDNFIGCMATFTDITNQRITTENLLQLSHYDPLTNLPNRSLLMQQLQNALEPNEPGRLALVFIDLDGFKLVNDTLGHSLGNKLILEVSHRINSCLKPTDLLARLGSDEFTAIVNEDADPGRAARVTRNILNAIKRPITVDQETVYISASAGIAVAKPGITASKLIQQADVAMYNAKKRKGNTVQFHNHELTAQNRAKLIVSGHLHTALDQNEFSVYYQPQLDIRSNSICGSEALLRWKNPQLGTISPNVFIPLLEDRGLINKVGEWVLSEACHKQAQWHQDYNARHTTVSVNVSGLQLHDRHFLNKLKNILASSGLPPDCLVLEITETVLLDEYVSECNLLHEISALGVKIAIDDFGTGYGSFSYLQKHPIDHIKIDRSFVVNLFESEENKAITNSIIDLSHQLGKTVIAEGVDKQEELDFLMMKGCDMYQGFLSSRAIPSVDFANRFLKTNKCVNALIA